MKRLRGHAELAEGVLGETLLRREPVREAGERPLQQLEQPLARARQRGCDRHAEEVQRCGERQDVEVGDRDDAILVRDDQRVLLRGVELRLQLALGELERVARRAVDLRQAAEGERILEVARRARPPEVAPFQEAADALEGEAEPRIRPDVADGRMEHRQIGGERLEVHGARDVERAHEPFRVRDGEGGERRREGVRVDECDALFGEELEVSEELGGEVCHRSEVALPDRSEHVDARPFSLVQRAHDALCDLRPDS